MTRDEKRITALVLGVVAFLFLFGLGALGFFDPDEGRYAAIPTAMLRTGDFVVPYLQGFPYLEKPPLLYWMTAATIAVSHTEFAARLPVALMGFAGVLAILVLAWRTLGPRVAWVSAGLLALNMQWFIQARFLTTDMVLAGLLTVGICLFYIGYLTDRRRWYALFYVCVALATLTKGIIGFLLPGMIVFLFIVFTREWRLFRRIQLPLGALIGAVIVVPWFVLVQERFPDFLRYFIYDQHVARYVADNAEHEKPFWFFVPVMVAGFFPWICYLPFVRRRDRDAWNGDSHHSGPLNMFLWLWFLVIFVFFSISKGKLISYVLPACPPLAMLTAEFVARAFAVTRDEDVVRRLRRGAFVVALIWIAFAPAALVGLPWLVVRDGRLNLADVSTWPYIFAAVWGAGGLLTLVFALRGRVRSLLAVQAAVTAAVFFTMLGAALAIEPFMNPKPLGVALAREVKPGDLVAIYKVPQPSVEFYLGYPPMLICFAGEYKYGISLQPNDALFQPDEKALDRLLHSDRRVYFVADRDSFKPSDVTAPIELVAQTTKRVVYRNLR